MGNVVPVGRAFLSGDFSDFDRQEAAAEPPPARARRAAAASTADSEVEGWLALVARRNFAAASEHFEEVAQGLQEAEREHRAFWRYQQAFAELLHADRDGARGSRERALGLLDAAIREGAS